MLRIKRSNCRTALAKDVTVADGTDGGYTTAWDMSKYPDGSVVVYVVPGKGPVACHPVNGGTIEVADTLDGQPICVQFLGCSFGYANVVRPL